MNNQRFDPPTLGAERDQLVGFLNYQRQTLLAKCRGLSDEQLRRRLKPSALTLGGLLSHMTFVEDMWFSYVTAGNKPAEPWASADWEADEDFEMHRGETLGGDELRAGLGEAIALSESITAGAELDSPSVRDRHGEHVSLRWVLLHMLEEYARHNGHADLIRESIDGAVGE